MVVLSSEVAKDEVKAFMGKSIEPTVFLEKGEAALIFYAPRAYPSAAGGLIVVARISEKKSLYDYMYKVKEQLDLTNNIRVKLIGNEADDTIKIIKSTWSTSDIQRTINILSFNEPNLKRSLDNLQAENQANFKISLSGEVKPIEQPKQVKQLQNDGGPLNWLLQRLSL